LNFGKSKPAFKAFFSPDKGNQGVDNMDYGYALR